MYVNGLFQIEVEVELLHAFGKVAASAKVDDEVEIQLKGDYVSF